ncbi:MAG: GNAT family N-acetyltransferase [Candidatus Methanofastidiosa archaeon]|nr:GNAT family N-acetyltransferase [Candidatus Methanofastidiosa archaeon]
MISSIEIRDLEDKNEYFVGTCSHLNESEEIDHCSEIRLKWLKNRIEKGADVKVAHVAGVPRGFIYSLPIEISPWGPIGKDCYCIPCLYVTNDHTKQGIGRKLIEAVAESAIQKGATGIVTMGYYHDMWFMPANYFIKNGFTPLVRRGEEVLLGRSFSEQFKIPKLLTPNYKYVGQQGKVVVDLFWNAFCQTCVIEALRVKRICKEMGKDVVLNEYRADIGYVLDKYQIPRGVFINGKEYYWGYEAPAVEIRGIIMNELNKIK